MSNTNVSLQTVIELKNRNGAIVPLSDLERGLLACRDVRDATTFIGQNRMKFCESMKKWANYHKVEKPAQYVRELVTSTKGDLNACAQAVVSKLSETHVYNHRRDTATGKVTLEFIPVPKERASKSSKLDVVAVKKQAQNELLDKLLSAGVIDEDQHRAMIAA